MPAREPEVQVCCLKPAVGSATAVELTLQPPSDRAALAGWAVDSLKVSAAPGDRKPVTLSLSVPATPPAASAAAFGAAEFAVMVLEGVVTGGAPAAPPGGRPVRVIVRAWVKPEAGIVDAPAGKGKK